MTDKLKNCPFCGSEHISYQFAERMKPQPHFVACLTCGATGRYTQEKWYALQSWNSRASNTQIESLTAQLEEATKALEFYADKSNYNDGGPDNYGGRYECTIEDDNGQVAEQALSTIRGK